MMLAIDLDAEPVDASTVISLTERVTLALREFSGSGDERVAAHRPAADAVPGLLRQLFQTAA